mmetsp:Transcript_9750/g.17660  ORF Transcript_9750/g.17660 Transcript_9750/m.17660 type:complete len:286 (-) Transcript_9750:273-1130(-)
MPFGLVGVLDRAALVKDLGAADVELLDFDGEGTVSGLGFSDGDVVFGLRSVHVKNMRLPQHIPHDHILGLPLARTRRSFRTMIIILHHTLPLRLHDLHRLIRNVKLHNHRPRGSTHGLHGLIRLSYLPIVHLEQHVSQSDPRRVGRAAVDGEGYHRTFSDGLDEGIGCRLVQRRAEFFRGGEDGAEHGGGDARLVVFASGGQAAFVEGDGETVVLEVVRRRLFIAGGGGGGDAGIAVVGGGGDISGGRRSGAESHIVPEVGLVLLRVSLLLLLLLFFYLVLILFL